MTPRILAAAAVTAALLLAVGDLAGQAVSTQKTQPYAAGANGIGDPYYPSDGNAGYNVHSYHVSLDYFPTTKSIAATTTIRSVATARLHSFHLDFEHLKVSALMVDGRLATWRHAGAHELVVTPVRAIRKGKPFLAQVTYHGKLTYVLDGGEPSGWLPARTPGSGYLMGEPHGCAVWYPCNDHPTDKARFSLTATVPRPLAVVSMGDRGRTTSGRRDGVAVRTYRWRLAERTATYLTGMYIDRLTFERSRLADGTTVISAYGPRPGQAPRRERRLPEILRVLSRRWGSYPAPAAGGIFISDAIPYELETYTRPMYSRSTPERTIVHENGHQWWGDNVSVRRWQDICLNECLASYSEWLWDEHNGADLDQRYRRLIHQYGDPLFSGKLYDMGAGSEFDSPVYVKGKFFVHALRNKIGDVRFFRAMRAIQRNNAGGNLSMNGLRDQLEHRTGVDLTTFWRQWVNQHDRPSDANLYPGDL